MTVYPKYRRLCELANVYIKDGKLIKYRWGSLDKQSEDYHFSNLSNNKGEIGDFGMRTLLSKLSVAVETNGKVVLHNFSSDYLALWMNSYEYEQAKFYNLVEEN